MFGAHGITKLGWLRASNHEIEPLGAWVITPSGGETDHYQRHLSD